MVTNLRHADLFLLEGGPEDLLLYAPLSSMLVRLNAAAAVEVARYLDTGLLPAGNASLCEAIRQMESVGTGEVLPIPEVNRPFLPNRVTVFPINACNLRCSYCYAEAGRWQTRQIDPGFCETAIDFVAANPRPKGMPLPINFHGGGEPTLGWGRIKHCVDYATRRMEGADKVVFSMASNGVLTEEQIRYIADRFENVNVSMDGPQDIQDAQRPFASGAGTYAKVMATIAGFHKHGVKFSIRATITSATVERMPEIAEFFIREAGCKAFHLEPVFECGRCQASATHSPDPDFFARFFAEAYDLGRAQGASVCYSGARIAITLTSFCGVSNDSFSITPDGHVTACYEVCRNNHPLASTFIYGEFIPEERRIRIDMKRLKALRLLRVTNKPYCDKCFCRWHCAGDCPVKPRTMQMDFNSPTPRCRMNQSITRHILRRTMEEIDASLAA